MLNHGMESGKLFQTKHFGRLGLTKHPCNWFGGSDANMIKNLLGLQKRIGKTYRKSYRKYDAKNNPGNSLNTKITRRSMRSLMKGGPHWVTQTG